MITQIPLSYYLILAAGLFCLGLFGALARRNAIAVLMGIELMLNAVNINLVAFWRYGSPDPIVNQAGIVFALFVITLAAAEAAVGLALVIAIYRSRDTVNVEDIDLLKW
jgi:NADH-quinone oxidoreductase subunit K